MDAVMGALNWYAVLPSAVMVMAGIFLVGLLLARLKIGEALRRSNYVAGALVAMSTMVGMFSGAATPALTQVVEATGLKLDIIDLGLGPAYSSVLFPLSFYAILLVVGLADNALMIVLKLTDTFDVDVFNYSVWALASSYVWATTYGTRREKSLCDISGDAQESRTCEHGWGAGFPERCHGSLSSDACRTLGCA